LKFERQIAICLDKIKDLLGECEREGVSYRAFCAAINDVFVTILAAVLVEKGEKVVNEILKEILNSARRVQPLIDKLMEELEG